MAPPSQQWWWHYHFFAFSLPPIFSFWQDPLLTHMSIATTITPTWQSLNDRIQQRPPLAWPKATPKSPNQQKDTNQRASKAFVPKGIPVPPWKATPTRTSQAST
jgi:hypothetical protein